MHQRRKPLGRYVREPRRNPIARRATAHRQNHGDLLVLPQPINRPQHLEVMEGSTVYGCVIVEIPEQTPHRTTVVDVAHYLGHLSADSARAIDNEMPHHPMPFL